MSSHGAGHTGVSSNQAEQQHRKLPVETISLKCSQDGDKIKCELEVTGTFDNNGIFSYEWRVVILRDGVSPSPKVDEGETIFAGPTGTKALVTNAETIKELSCNAAGKVDPDGKTQCITIFGYAEEPATGSNKKRICCCKKCNDISVCDEERRNLADIESDEFAIQVGDDENLSCEDPLAYPTMAPTASLTPTYSEPPAKTPAPTTPAPVTPSPITDPPATDAPSSDEDDGGTPTAFPAMAPSTPASVTPSPITDPPATDTPSSDDEAAAAPTSAPKDSKVDCQDYWILFILQLAVGLPLGLFGISFCEW